LNHASSSSISFPVITASCALMATTADSSPTDASSTDSRALDTGTTATDETATPDTAAPSQPASACGCQGSLSSLAWLAPLSVVFLRRRR